MNNWIPVSERLPKDYDNVLINIDASKSSVITIGYYDGISWWTNYGSHLDSKRITAWQFLPEPYKPEENEKN